jgi:hypothetical protein
MRCDGIAGLLLPSGNDLAVLGGCTDPQSP